MITYVLGADPGPTTGLAAISITNTRITDVNLMQVTHGIARPLVAWLLSSAHADRIVFAVERFVVGPRAARSATPEAGRITRDLVGALHALAHARDARVIQRSAADVKPWATDVRLKAIGLEVFKGMPDAKDAARHALYSAVRDCSLPDPLIRHRSPEVTRD